jgi:hypothetical protein
MNQPLRVTPRVLQRGRSLVPRRDDRKAVPFVTGPARSGRRLLDAVLEPELVLSRRILGVSQALSDELARGGRPILALGLLVHVLESFVEPVFYTRAEEAILPVALARGLPSSLYARVLRAHEQGRTYFRTLALLLQRIEMGETGAFEECELVLQAFVKFHRACLDEDGFRLEIGLYVDGEGERMIAELMQAAGPDDLMSFADVVASIESALDDEAE